MRVFSDKRFFEDLNYKNIMKISESYVKRSSSECILSCKKCIVYYKKESAPLLIGASWKGVWLWVKEYLVF